MRIGDQETLIYTYRDVTADAYLEIFEARTDALAYRFFGRFLGETVAEKADHGEFELYCLGRYNKTTGEIEWEKRLVNATLDLADEDAYAVEQRMEVKSGS